jgi:signal transduction histidine kinase
LEFSLIIAGENLLGSSGNVAVKVLGVDMTNVVRREKAADAPNSEVCGSFTEAPAGRLQGVGQSSAGLAHDVRNLLAAVDAGVRLAERSLDRPEIARTYLQAARGGINRVAQLTSGILSRATHETVAVSLESANDLVTDLMPLLKCAAGPTVQLKAKLTPKLPLCMTEASGFQNALLNLVINARDAMPGGGQVQISTDLVGTGCGLAEANAASFVRVSVKDQGQGMSSEIMQHVFAPFFTTKGKSGSGLGLPQVCAFVHSVDGHVKIASAPGNGTSVRMLFVASEAAMHNTEAVRPEARRFGGRLRQEGPPSPTE